MKWIILPLFALLLIPIVSPTTVFAQTQTITGFQELPHGVESITYEKFGDGYTWELDENNFLYKQWDADRLGTTPEPIFYPEVSQTETVIQVLQETGKQVYDKNNCAVTIYDTKGIVIDSDSYIIRASEDNGNNEWFDLSVNDSVCVSDFIDNDNNIIVTQTRTNNEGIFTMVHEVTQYNSKTTATFENQLYPNHKFAVTETLQVIDDIFVNDMPIDLDQYVGVTFDRNTLEQNNDLIIQVGELYYNSGIGFSQLYDVGIFPNNTVALSYANQDEIVPIGESLILDPHLGGNHPDTPTNFTANFNSPNVDLSWSASNSNSPYIVSSIANTTTINTPSTVTTCSGTTPTSPTTGVTGKIGNAWDYNGVCNVSFGIFPSASTGNFSESYWIYSDIGTNPRAQIPFGAINGLYNYYILNGQWGSYYDYNVVNVNGLYTQANAFTPNAWHHVVLTIDSNKNTKFYIDGVNQNLYSYPGQGGGGSLTTTGAYSGGAVTGSGWSIGAGFHTSGSHTYSFEGKLDEYSSWERILTQSEVNTLYNSGNGNTPDSISVNNDLKYYLPFDSTSLTNMAVVTDPITVSYNVIRDGTTISTGQSGTTYQDNSFSFGNTYAYQINAQTSYGTSGNSTTQNVTTGTPPDAPSISTSISDPLNQPHDVTVSWNEPVSWGSGTPQSYELYESVGTSGNMQLVNTINYSPGNTSTIHSISNILPLAQYHYMVRSVTNHGTSLDSNVSFITTPDVPDAPNTPVASIIDPDVAPLEIDLTFQEPFNGGNNIKGYQIDMWDSINGSWQTITANTANTNLNATVQNLVKNTSYQFKVAAINTIGTSPLSVESVSITTPDVPNAPTVSSTVQSDTEIVISWNPNYDGGSNVTSWDIIVDGVTINLNANVTSYTHSALSAASTHSYQVRGNNLLGNGVLSGVINVTTYPFNPNWIGTSLGNVAYNIDRDDTTLPEDLTLTVLRDVSPTWNLLCEYRTTDNVLTQTQGTVVPMTGVSIYIDTQGYPDSETIYITCSDGTTELFSTTSHGNIENALSTGLVLFDSMGGFMGAPAAMLMVLAVFSLATPRNSPTVLIIGLTVTGILGSVGLMYFANEIWGVLLVCGALGIFGIKRFF